jgi:hypothetical protein
MMSDSLKDIVSIGQLTGESSETILTLDGEAHTLDLHSFTRDKAHLRCLSFASRELIVKALAAKTLHAEISFEGSKVGSGQVVSLGYEPILIREDVHDMLMIHVKRDN